jgi:hypothetical protein
MEFNDKNKQTILELLKAGQRLGALQFIASEYSVSAKDAEKLLAAFENQFRDVVQEKTKPPGCIGCLSGAFKFFAVLMALFGVGIIAVGYFIPDVVDFGENDTMVPALVTSQYYYTAPDSTNVRLIVQYNDADQVKSDTTNMIFTAGMYFPGDSIHVAANEIDLQQHKAVTEFKSKTQDTIYIVGAAFLFSAFLFWLVINRLGSVLRKSRAM